MEKSLRKIPVYYSREGDPKIGLKIGEIEIFGSQLAAGQFVSEIEKIIDEKLGADFGLYEVVIWTSKETREFYYDQLMEMIDTSENFHFQLSMIISILPAFGRNKEESNKRKGEELVIFPKLSDIKLIPLTAIQFIEGPVTLVEFYSAKYRKHIYIFGDVHERFAPCRDDINFVSMDVFVNSLLKTYPNKFFDIFTESWFSLAKARSRPYTKKNYGGGFMHTFFLTFNDCFSQSNLCPYTNARFHHGDIRLLSEIIFNGIRTAYKEFSRIVRSISMEEKIGEETIKELSFYLKALHEFYGVLGNFKDYVDKMIKQLTNIKYTEVTDLILDNYNFFEAVYKRFHASFLSKDINEIIKGLNFFTIRMILLDILEFDEIFVLVFIDLYTLGRMFREFVPKETSKIKRKESSQNIIYWAGDLHARNITYMLIQLGFEVKNTSYSGKYIPTSSILKTPHTLMSLLGIKLMEYDTQCLDVTKFQPFFGGRPL